MAVDNEKWDKIRLGYLSQLAGETSLERIDGLGKTIELLDACQVSEILRHLTPYRSLVRFGLWRYDPYEREKMDEFVCLYFHEGRYTVSSYDYGEKRYFENAQAAIDFVEQKLNKDNPFV